MLQFFSRSTRKATRILNIGCVTQDPEMGSQFKDFVAEREGVDLTLITSVFVYDLDVSADSSMREFDRFMQCRPKDIPVIVLSPAVDDELVRWLLRLKVADWIKTPLTPGELIAACGRVISHAGQAHADTRCFTFMGARGGVGATTIALHAALALAAKAAPTVTACVVDLDLVSGSCAEYLDLKSNWQIDELISDPARLDQHMLDTMIASHAGGIAVLSTHRKFTDRLEFSEEVVTRTMDLAAQKYQTLVVDLPRHAESWSEGVLLGSSQVYVVTDLTIPGLKSARRMIDEISKQFGGEVMARAIVNKYYKPLFSTGLSATTPMTHWSGKRSTAGFQRPPSNPETRSLPISAPSLGSNRTMSICTAMSLVRAINPHSEVAAKRPSKGLLQQSHPILMDASRLPRLSRTVRGKFMGRCEMPLEAKIRVESLQRDSAFPYFPLLPRTAWEKVPEGRMRALCSSSINTSGSFCYKNLPRRRAGRRGGGNLRRSSRFINFSPDSPAGSRPGSHPSMRVF
ncbi:MAG: hypothetical protein E6G89_02980 [Alphaproteobacteria bacterium]|nr:MAG: hypothetical protein E6G89_02980 [Alphaproteobacteria bacterium]